MLIVAGDHVLTDPRAGTVLRDGAVLVVDGRVAETGPRAAMERAHPEAEVVGGAGRLVMPGLIDAHSHGRGPVADPEGRTLRLPRKRVPGLVVHGLPAQRALCRALSAVRHLRMGCTAIHHTGWNDEGPGATGEARKAVNAYRSSGIRLAYSPAVRNRNRFVPDEAGFLRTLPPDLAEWMRPTLTYDADKIEHDYFDQFEALREEFETGADGTTRVLLAPSWAHGTTERFLHRVRDRAQQLGGLPVHIHTLQTPHQRAFGLKAFGKSLVAYLRDQGLLRPNLTLGHAVWLSEDDIALIAEAGAGITHHASCNLHVRNGIAPVWHMMRAGVRVAMGIDDKSLNDDDDPFQELRLASVLHRVPGFSLDQETRLPADRMARHRYGERSGGDRLRRPARRAGARAARRPRRAGHGGDAAGPLDHRRAADPGPADLPRERLPGARRGRGGARGGAGPQDDDHRRGRAEPRSAGLRQPASRRAARPRPRGAAARATPVRPMRGRRRS